MDEFDKTAEWIGKVEEERPELAEAIARTEIVEQLRMVNGEEEVTPPMTLEEFDTFLTEEDERLGEAVENAEPLDPPRVIPEEGFSEFGNE